MHATHTGFHATEGDDKPTLRLYQDEAREGAGLQHGQELSVEYEFHFFDPGAAAVLLLVDGRVVLHLRQVCALLVTPLLPVDARTGLCAGASSVSIDEICTTRSLSQQANSTCRLTSGLPSPGALPVTDETVHT
jgi:hypothetical protein